MSNEFCAMCGVQLMWVESERTRSRFCSDDCKVDYHNTRRKMNRAYNRAIDAIDIIGDWLTSDSELALEAVRLLEDIRSRSDNTLASVRWRCSECGQTRMNRPTDSDHCSFCQASDWRIQLPG